MLKVRAGRCAQAEWSDRKRAAAAATDSVVVATAAMQKEKRKERPQNLNRRQKLDRVKLHCECFASKLPVEAVVVGLWQ